MCVKSNNDHTRTRRNKEKEEEEEEKEKDTTTTTTTTRRLQEIKKNQRFFVFFCVSCVSSERVVVRECSRDCDGGGVAELTKRHD